VRGRQFLEGEIRAGRAACVIGETVRAELFSVADAIGRNIRVKNVACEVIGVLQAKGQSSFGTDQDDIVLMPLRAVQRRVVGNPNIARMYVSAADGVATAKVQADIERLLRERRKIGAGEDDDFTVRDMRQILLTQTGTTSVLTALLGAVAGVSLLVGGIGIMNIMLVSVTERTREIGLRMAVGARRRDILSQFLIEAVTLCVLGGLIGLLIGGGAALAMSIWGNWPIALSPNLVVIALLSAGLVGVFFGYYPARRAALMNPIDALRYE
jgi:putative ABC transport system permease protein